MGDWHIEMTTPRKIFLGLATISPFVFFAIFISTVAYLFVTLPTTGVAQDEIDHFMKYAWIINSISSAFIVFFLAIQIVFIIHAANNHQLEIRKTRTAWLITIILFGPWVMPFYWFFYIWSDGAPDASGTPKSVS